MHRPATTSEQMAPAEVADPVKAAEPPLKKLKRKLPTLPVSNKILGLLTELQKNVSPTKKEAHIQAIVHTMIDNHGEIESEANQYLLKRLVSGVAASTGESRLNYSAVLMRITREHSCSVSDIYGAVTKVYGDGGTFSDDYARGKIDRIVGSVVATAAVVRGASEKKVGPDVARSMVQTLRRAVVGDASKWGLGLVVVKVVCQLLSVAENVAALKKILWKWAEDRKLSHDGITLTLLLQMEYKLIPDTAMSAMYKDMDQIATALASMFESGFERNSISGKQECPVAWKLALEYSSTEKGREHTGGVAVFWDKVVSPKLADGVTNMEKNLLLRKLAPIALRLVRDDEKIELILNKLLIMKLSSGMFRTFTKKKKKSMKNDDFNKQLSELETELSNELAQICGDESVTVERRAWLAEMLVRWVCRYRRFAAGSEKIIMGIPQALDGVVAKDLVLRIIHSFLVPEGGSPQDVDRLRLAYLSALERIVAGHPELMGVFTAGVVVASAFVDTKSGNVESVQADDDEEATKLSTISDVALKNMKAFEKGLEKGNIKGLPSIHPVLGEECAAKAYAMLIDVLLKSKNYNVSAKHLEKATSVIHTVMKKKSNGFKLRNGADEVSQISDAIVKLNESDKAKSESNVVKCLALIADFLVVSNCDPARKKSGSVSKISEQLQKAVNSFGGDENEGKTENAPSSLEQTVHLLCVMCGEDERFGDMARLAAELLVESADDSVTAVLFDMLEAAMKGNEEEEDDEDSEMAEMGDEDEDDAVEVVSVDGDVNGGNDVEAGNTKPMEIDDDDGSENDLFDADIDPDKEDPQVLQRLDEHLSNHMKLLADKNKSAHEQRMRTNTKVERLLNIIQVIVNGIRLRVEKANAEVDKKAVVVMFDVFVRFVEFENWTAHAKRVSDICDKQMCRRKLYATEMKDVALVGEFADRLVEVGKRKNLGVLTNVVRRLLMVVKDVLEVRKGKKDRKRVKDVEEILEKLEK